MCEHTLTLLSICHYVHGNANDNGNVIEHSLSQCTLCRRHYQAACTSYFIYLFIYLFIFLSHTESGASCLKNTLQDRSLIDYRMIKKLCKSQANENKSVKTAVLPLQEDFESHGWAKTAAEHLASEIKHTE